MDKNTTTLTLNEVLNQILLRNRLQESKQADEDSYSSKRVLPGYHDHATPAS